MKEKRDRIICFSTTETQMQQLRALAPSRDSLSSLMREIIQQYLSNLQPPAPATEK
jgi:hypothetical protein